MLFCYFYRTGIGMVCIEETNSEISHIYFEDEPVDEFIDVAETELIRECYNQLNEYFKGERRRFTVPFTISGTEFQQEVYRLLLEVPYGRTASYSEIALKMGMPRGARAVGGAVNRNPVPIIIPCHRIVGKDGSLTGYAGGLAIKEKLLELESNEG